MTAHRKRMGRAGRRGFTLVELLVAAAILTVLALIALPNFLEAQVRSKVVRTVSDFRVLALALEAYAVDWGGYPLAYWWVEPPPTASELLLGDMLGTPQQNYGELAVLTTPLAYLTTIPVDPFNLPRPSDYTHLQEGYRRRNLNHPGDTWWSLRSLGPDRKRDKGVYYDPTNGTMSAGDIVRTNESYKGYAGVR